MFTFLLVCSLVKLFFNYGHFLVSLLTLEFISVSFFIFFSLSLACLCMETVFMLYFLVILVCEGVLGFCVLIRARFTFGRDLLRGVNLV